MLIYNLFPLLAGPFGDWEPHFKRAADMGFDWVFINPVQKPGYSGSLYSIVDYLHILNFYKNFQELSMSYRNEYLEWLLLGQANTSFFQKGR